MRHILLVRHSSVLREVSQSDALMVLEKDERELERRHIEVTTADLNDAVEQGDWVGHKAILRRHAARIRQEADEYDTEKIHYLGLAEIPHIVTLGAYIGYEREIVPHDHHGEAGAWKWPSAGRTVGLKTLGSEVLGTTIKARGEAVLRVSISAVVSDDDVYAVVGDEMLADLCLTLNGDTPKPGAIKSQEDVAAVRQAFRDIYCQLRNARPGIDLIHLFVAAPPSVCFVIGQELNPRNSPPIQTYRYRNGGDTIARQEAAILISESAGQPLLTPLSSEEQDIAGRIRASIWPEVVREIETYCKSQQMDGNIHGLWFDHLIHKEALRLALPFPALPSLASFLPTGVSVSATPLEEREFYFVDTENEWRLNDRLLAGFARVAKDEGELRRLIALFLFHEYIHLFHSITKRTAEEVGKFANCLEYIDYTADVYALIHQMDFYRSKRSEILEEDGAIQFLAEQIDLVIRSFWAFDEGNGNEWQVRRIRRYFNWYWRLAQMQRVQKLEVAMSLLATKPHVEIGGLKQISRGRRTFARLNHLDETTHLEMALVMDNAKLYRVSESPNTKLSELLRHFLDGNHEGIKGFFSAVYDIAEGHGSTVLPSPRCISTNNSLTMA